MGKEPGKGRRRGTIPSERREMRMEKLGKGGKGQGKTRGNREKMYGMGSNTKSGQKEKIVVKRISLFSVFDIYMSYGRKL